MGKWCFRFFGCLRTYLKTILIILMTILAGSQVSDPLPFGLLVTKLFRMAKQNDSSPRQLQFTSKYFSQETSIVPFLDGNVLRRRSYGVYISQLLIFARVCSPVDNFNARN